MALSCIVRLISWFRCFILPDFSSETVCVWEKIPVIAFRYTIHTHSHGRYHTGVSIEYNCAQRCYCDYANSSPYYILFEVPVESVSICFL